jgi:hypothetical protein
MMQHVPADLLHLRGVNWEHIDRKDKDYFELGVSKIITAAQLQQRAAAQSPTSVSKAGSAIADETSAATKKAADETAAAEAAGEPEPQLSVWPELSSDSDSGNATDMSDYSCSSAGSAAGLDDFDEFEELERTQLQFGTGGGPKKKKKKKKKRRRRKPGEAQAALSTPCLASRLARACLGKMVDLSSRWWRTKRGSFFCTRFACSIAHVLI